MAASCECHQSIVSVVAFALKSSKNTTNTNQLTFQALTLMEKEYL